MITKLMLAAALALSGSQDWTKLPGWGKAKPAYVQMFSIPPSPPVITGFSLSANGGGPAFEVDAAGRIRCYVVADGTMIQQWRALYHRVCDADLAAKKARHEPR